MLTNLECERICGPEEMVQNWEQEHKVIATQEVKDGKLSKI